MGIETLDAAFEPYVVIAIIVVLAALAAASVFLYSSERAARDRESWADYRRTVRRPSDATGVRNDTTWSGLEVEGRLRHELGELEQAGYRARLIKLPEGTYCVIVSGVLPTEECTASLYMECGERYPLMPPNVYAEVLRADHYDDFGQAETQEVMLSSLANVVAWDPDPGALLAVTQEAFAQMDESYRPSPEPSGFFNDYGEWIQAS